MKSKNSSLGDLITNFSSLMKYKLGVEKPPKKKKASALGIVGVVSGVALGLAGGLLFANESGRETRKKIARSFNDAKKRTSQYTAKEINRLNEITKEQLAKIRKGKKEAVG